MKVAIMGAGLSGLCCAIILEQNGIIPDIYEKRRMPGDRFINGEAFFNIATRPINNCLDFIRDKYKINLEPVNEIREIIIRSPKETAVVSGNLGCTNLRGRHEKSFESQLTSQVKSNIIFNSEHTYEELSKEYSHVVLATGDAAYAIKLNNFTCDLTINAKGATVEGRFNTSHITNWYNNDFAPKGYAYLIPFNGREAHIVIAFPNYEENKKKDINSLFDKFYSTVVKDIGQGFRITDRFEIKDYILGVCHKPKIGNTYFTGNCFGCIMPAFGLGQFQAILTGIYAGFDICGKGDYEELVKPLMDEYKDSLVLRRTVEQLDNKKYDLIVKHINGKIAGGLLGDEININFLRAASKLIRPFIDVDREMER